jgi:hypothetical protein
VSLQPVPIFRSIFRPDLSPCPDLSPNVRLKGGTFILRRSIVDANKKRRLDSRRGRPDGPRHESVAAAKVSGGKTDMRTAWQLGLAALPMAGFTCSEAQAGII